jgi:hypothetical protein
MSLPSTVSRTINFIKSASALCVVLLCCNFRSHAAVAAVSAVVKSEGVVQVTQVNVNAGVTVEISGQAASVLYKQLLEQGKLPYLCGDMKIVRNDNIACYVLKGQNKHRCLMDMDLQNSDVNFRDLCIQPSIIGVMN